MSQTASLDLFKDLPLQAKQAKRVKATGPKIPPEEEAPPSENPNTIPAEEVPLQEPDEPDEDDDELPAAKVTELDILKQRATLMGISFSNNIGVDMLRAKVQAKLDGEIEFVPIGEILPASPKPTVNARQQMIDEEMKLVRLRIINLDPKKKDLPGEIFTVANEILGVVKKYIPYGEATDGGYHVPYIIYRQLKEREFLNIKTRKDNRGRTIIETGMAREFALEILPQLTQKELNQLAAQQAAASGMSN